LPQRPSWFHHYLLEITMKNLKPLLVAGALAALPLSSMADGLSYNYIEGGYTKATLEDGNADDFDFDGFSVAGSGKFTDNFFVFGDYRFLESDTVGGTKAELNSGRAGLGFIVPINDRFHLNAGGGASFGKFEYKGTGAGATPDDNDDTGYFLQGIARAQVLPALEINGGYRFEKIFDSNESTGLIGAVFNFTPALGVLGNYEFGDGTDRYTLGGRYSFGL
jgi:hypothetical protein